MIREEKINTLKAIIQECEEYEWQRRETFFEIIKDLEHEPKTGHWEHGKELGREYQGKTLVDITYEDWHCSNCHCAIEQSSKPKWSYCPSCGAKMVEPQESEEICNAGYIKKEVEDGNDD